MNKSRLIITSVISIVLVAILMMGSTYSIFTTTEVDENANVYTTGNLNVTYTLSSSNVQITNITPMTIEEASNVKPYRITVTNNGTVPYMFDVILTDTSSSTDNTIDYQYIMTKVGYLEPKKLSSCTNNIIKEDVIVPAGESVDIDVRVWLGANLSNSEMGKSFYAKLSIDGKAIYDDNTDIDNDILSLRYMNTSTTNDIRSDTYREYIKTASFVNYIDTSNASLDTTTNEKIMWDMSTKQNDSIIAWLEPADTEGQYNLYIGSEFLIHATDLSNFYKGMTNLQSINFDNLDTSLVTNMSYMFSDCGGLTSLDLRSFNTSNVTNMIIMFGYCSNLASIDVSSFDTSKVTAMNGMFRDCNSLISLDLSEFDTSNVTNMFAMFFNCKAITSLDLRSFNTSNVENMNKMFHGCVALVSLDVSSFDTSNVTDMSYMFRDCGSLISLDLSRFDTSNVTNMSYMFNACDSLVSLDVSEFNTSKVTDMGYMFIGCHAITSLDLSSFNTSNVTNMNQMFYRCDNLTSLNISGWNTSSVTSMASMFHGCSKLSTTITIRNINTTGYGNMFWDAATAEGAQITINYVGDNPTTTDVNESTEALVEAMVATKSTNSNVVSKCYGDYCSAEETVTE